MKNFRVYLRALELDDYKTTIKWRNDDDIWSMVGGPKYFVSSEYEKNWVLNSISNTKDIRLGICLKQSDELIGLASITDIEWINRSAHCPSMIGEKAYWSEGLGTEARILLLKFAFHERNFERIWAHILESNIGSMKMVEKCGYVKEGLLRNSIFKSGKYHNQIVMSVLREEFDEILETMRDLRSVGCDIITIGQYLRPSQKHLPVQRFVTPEEFLQLRDEGYKMGFDYVESGPMIRSSYHSEKQTIPGYGINTWRAAQAKKA